MGGVAGSTVPHSKGSSLPQGQWTVLIQNLTKATYEEANLWNVSMAWNCYEQDIHPYRQKLGSRWREISLEELRPPSATDQLGCK